MLENNEIFVDMELEILSIDTVWRDIMPICPLPRKYSAEN